MTYGTVEELLENHHSHQKEWDDYIQARKKLYEKISVHHIHESMVSEVNWFVRKQYPSIEEMKGMNIAVGDIVYLDYGQVYLNEMGYQHFGLVMAIFRKKAFIIPMTSNPHQYASAYDEIENPKGKRHLFRIGMVGELNKESVLFMNDMKFLNTARIIDRKGHIDTDSPLFLAIQQRMSQILFSTNEPQNLIR